MTTNTGGGATWRRALAPDELAEGRVATVTLGVRTLCMSHFEGRYTALDNRCPHQGGPLGEGTIENGWLRCPWHGWDYCPHTGKPPGGFDDGVETFPVEIRDDGVWVEVPDEPPHVQTVGDVLIETMAGWGVRWCFGMVGHSNLYLADAVRRQAPRMSYIGVRHEGAASFAASAYGKLTGRPASCLAIAGPGATNLLTGLWDANVDRSPVIAVTGQVSTQVLGRHNFQEVDLKAAFGGVAQWSQTVLPASPHAELMSLACKSALVNRGVSHVIVPDEVAGRAVPDARAAGPKGRMGDPQVAPSDESLDAAASLIRAAKRPVFVVGHGARWDMAAIVALAEHLNAPVVTTFKGKGLLPDSHPLAGGVLGRSGTPIASWLMNESDALVVLGASFSNHTGITPKKPTVHVDADPMTLAKFHAVDVPVLGAIGPTLTRLRERLRGATPTDQTADVAARWRLWIEEKGRRLQETRGQGISSIAVFDALTRLCPKDAIIAVDVGNNTYSFGRYFECARQSVLMSGYLGSIGFAYPAAMGAWAATQEDDPRFHGRKVIAVSGDGGFGQYMGELLTAVKYDMDITHVLLANGELGKISKEQRAGRWDVWETKLHNPSFAAYAESAGALGLHVVATEKLEDALERAIAHRGPSLVEVITDPGLI